MEFYSLVTNYGLNRQISVLSNNQTIKLTKMAIGDSELPIDQNLSDIRGKKHQFSINSIEQDQKNATMLIATGVVPSDVGGFYIREVGIYDDKDQLFAVAKIAPTYKPLLSEGSAKDLTIKFYLQVENVSNIELKIDPSVVIATRKWALDEINALIPAGTIIQSASQSTPGGYLKCNGASISRVSYQKLFGVIGTTFGSDDNNTFRLPDLRGRFVRGFSDGSSIDGDREFGSSQDDENKEHYHLMLTGNGAQSSSEKSLQTFKNFLKSNGYEELVKDALFQPEVATGYLNYEKRIYHENVDFVPKMPTSKSGSESRPYNIALNFYIKY